MKSKTLMSVRRVLATVLGLGAAVLLTGCGGELDGVLQLIEPLQQLFEFFGPAA